MKQMKHLELLQFIDFTRDDLFSIYLIMILCKENICHNEEQ